MRISVIVPVYNAGALLNKCIDSILGQTYGDFELILSDDGSTDGSGEVCDSYALRDPRVKAIHQKNAGSSAARNAGIAVATGDYYSFVDSDDYVEPDFLERLAEPIVSAAAAGKPEPLIVQIGRNEISASGACLPDICTPPEKKTFISSEDFLKSLLLHVGDCSMCTKLVKKDLFEGNGFPEGRLNEDFKVLIYMLLKCDGVVSLPGYKYHVYYAEESNTRKKNKNDFSRVYGDCIDNADEVQLIVKLVYPKLKAVALRFGLFQRLEYLLHIPIVHMRDDYEGYKDCVHYVRSHWVEGIFSRYLTGKNKLYLTLFAIAPKFVRVVHAKIRLK